MAGLPAEYAVDCHAIGSMLNSISRHMVEL